MSPLSTNRSVHSLSSGDYADVSSMSRSSSGGLRRSVARSRYSQQQENVEPVNTAVTPTANELQRSSVTPVTTAECSRTSSGAGMLVSSAHTTPEFEQQSTTAGQRHSSNSLLPTLSSRADSGGLVSTVSHGRLQSSSSLFSEDDIGAVLMNEPTRLSHHSDRTSAASADRQSSSSNASLFRLPFPQPKRASKRSSSASSTATRQSMHSPPQRAARYDFRPLPDIA